MLGSFNLGFEPKDLPEVPLYFLSALTRDHSSTEDERAGLLVQVGVEETHSTSEQGGSAYTHTHAHAHNRPCSRSSPSSKENDPVRAGAVLPVGSGGLRRLQRAPGSVRRHHHRENFRAGAVRARRQRRGLRQVSLHRHVSRRKEVRLQVSVPK